MDDKYLREIYDRFPYPIIVYFVKLRTDECLDPGWLRLKYILATGEAISRFFGTIVFSECRATLENSGGSFSPALQSDFKKRFKTISWGNWMHFSREGLRWLVNRQVEITMPELADFFLRHDQTENLAASALSELLTLRNGLSHDRIKAMHSWEFKDLCDKSYPKLEAVLNALHFLLDYELASVRMIEVFKKRREMPSFIHSLSKLAGKSDDWEGDRKPLEAALDSSAVFLINTKNSKYLNLDPLLIYEGKAGKVPDIFFYNGMKSSKNAEYVGCKQGGTFTSSNCDRASEIAEELNNLIALFTQTDPQEISNA